MAMDISSISPTTGAIGTAVTILGADFGATRDTSTVTVGGYTAETQVWSDATIRILIPREVRTTLNDIVVTVLGVGSTPFQFTATGTLRQPGGIGF